MISWLRCMIGSWLMIGRGRGAIRSRLMIGRSRRAVRSRLMISGLGCMIRGWFVVGRLTIGSRLLIGTGVGSIGLLRCVGSS